MSESESTIRKYAQATPDGLKYGVVVTGYYALLAVSHGILATHTSIPPKIGPETTYGVLSPEVVVASIVLFTIANLIAAKRHAWFWEEDGA